MTSMVAMLEAELRGANARYKKIEEDIEEAATRTEKAEARAAAAEGQAARRIAAIEVELQQVLAVRVPVTLHGNQSDYQPRTRESSVNHRQGRRKCQ